MALPSLLFNTQRFILKERKYFALAKSISSCVDINIKTTQILHYHTSDVLLKRRKTQEERKSARIIEFSPKPKSEVIDVWKNITIGEISEILNRDVNYVSDLFLNEFNGRNTVISDLSKLNEAIRRSGKRTRIISKPTDFEEETLEKDVHPRPPSKKEELKPRPPVITVMGHVDHGKTTLLDALRNTRVVDKEFGGITQHIGAFSLELKSGNKITFLDTPGHAAFSSMRQRGANITDMVVLVVAADDGVMEQTIESVKMARLANVPLIVAINKIDAPNADIDRTERMLMELGIQTEGTGGNVQAVPISALKKTNLDQLTEALIVQAEMLEIGADPNGPVEAVVVESRIDPYRGRLCTVIVQRGTLKKGDILIADTALCKVRNLKNANGEVMNSCTPGNPVEIEGWKDLPPAGEIVLQVDSEKRARIAIKVREDKKIIKKQEEDSVVIASKQEEHDKLYKEMLNMKRRMGRFRLRKTGPREKEIKEDDSGIPSLNLLIKSDVDGTLEALLNTVDTYEETNCELDLINYGVGAVTANDIDLAKSFDAVIYGFNITCTKEILDAAKDANVKIKLFNVIYKLIDDVKEEINSRLPPTPVEEIIGEATVLQQFDINDGKKKIPVAGSRCTKGSLKRSAMFRLIRDEEILFDGTLSSMRHLKNEVDTIKKDLECGLQLSDKNITFKQGDTLVCYVNKMEPQKTNWDPGF